MIELSRRKPADESIDYQTLEDVTFNQESRSTPVAVGGDKNNFVPSSLSDKSLTDGDDISYNKGNLHKFQGLHLLPGESIGRNPRSLGSCFCWLHSFIGSPPLLHYMSLSGERTGDEKKQAWPTRIGTGFAFVITSCFKAATMAALGQYIWTVVKRQPLSISTICTLYSIELLKGAKLAILLGAITWLLGRLASIAPAAALTIVAKNISEGVRLPVLDFSKASWNNSVDGQYNAFSQVSGSEWSQFYGPSIKCNEPNNTQQAIFNNITKYYEQNDVFTYDDKNDNRTNTTFGIGSGKISTPFKNESSYLIGNPSSTFTNTFSSTTRPWLCRNQTLARGMEDLANNISISYLSSPDLTSDSDLQTISTSNTNNYYVYHPFWLLISFGLAFLFSIMAVAVGIHAVKCNGVVHSNSFSATVATTRKPELDEFLGRSCLGAEPLREDPGQYRLRFGPVLDQVITGNHKSPEGPESQWQMERHSHVAFGIEHSVGQLRKGDLCI
ncbi:hypothetical protein EAF00_011068 [Botryotinia globosa]|nr:hypothetical protein EAF00_011068 [Botryotinia globosa]